MNSDAPIPLPVQAYIPGATPRPAEGSYDALRETAQPGMSVEALATSTAMRAGLAFLEHGFFWEAHEVLEPVWMACPKKSAERVYVQALIQIANAALKLKMERPKACLRLCAIAQAHLTEARLGGSKTILGHPVAEAEGRIDTLRRQASP